MICTLVFSFSFFSSPFLFLFFFIILIFLYLPFPLSPPYHHIEYTAAFKFHTKTNALWRQRARECLCGSSFQVFSPLSLSLSLFLPPSFSLYFYYILLHLNSIQKQMLYGVKEHESVSWNSFSGLSPSFSLPLFLPSLFFSLYLYIYK